MIYYYHYMYHVSEIFGGMPLEATPNPSSGCSLCSVISEHHFMDMFFRLSVASFRLGVAAISSHTDYSLCRTKPRGRFNGFSLNL
jgi:hypothetical protein